MKAKFLSVLLALTMVLSLLPTAVLAADGEEVAEINGTKYATLDAAIKAATDDQTIKLLNDTSTDTLKAGVTYDLAGHTLTYTGNKAFSYTGKAISFVDTSVSGTDRGGVLTAPNITTAVSAINVQSGATLNLNNITFRTPGSGFFPQGDAAAVNINNCDIYAGVYCLGTNAATTDNYNVVISLSDSNFYATSSDNDNCPIYINVTGTLNIDNCNVVGGRQGLMVRAGTVNITNSDIKTTGGYSNREQYYTSNWKSGNELPAAALIVGNYNAGAATAYFDNATVTLANTKLTGENNFPALYVDGNTTYKGTVTISGDNSVISGAVMKGQNPSAAEISISNGTFSDLTSAIAYAANGATIKLAADTTEDVVIPAGKDITLDLNGHKLSNVKDHTITNNGTLTITGNGTVDNTSHGKAALYNKGTATLVNGTFDRSNEAGKDANDNGGNSYYTILNHGVMTVEPDVAVYNKGHYSSLFENGYFNYNNKDGIDKPSLTIKGGLFDGGLNTIKNDDDATLEIKDGTFKNYTQAAFQNHNVATISGGTFDAPNVLAILNCGVCDGVDSTHDKHEATVTGGYFNGGVKATVGSISISGGHFTVDPSDYKAADKYVVASTESGYLYTLSDNPPEAATIVIKDSTSSTASNSASAALGEETANAITSNIEIDGAAEAISNDKKDDIATAAGVSSETLADSSNRIEIEVKVNVELTDASKVDDGSVTELTFTAEPIATVKVNGTVQSKTVGIPNRYLNDTPITVKLPLPAGFTPKQIAHKSDGYRTEYYLDHYERGAKHFTIDENNCAVFDITHFSTFVLSGTQTYVAPNRPSTSTGSTITVGKTENGTITVSPATASKGTNVTITAKPADGYELGSLTATDANGSALALTDLGNGKYSFTMPDGKVEVNGTFVKKSAQTFVDVPENAYYAPAVAWAVEKGVTEGTSATTFSPDAVCTRAQIVTFLYRAAGSPAVKSAVNPFTDVNASDYYYNAVLWAVENGITTGTSETTFSPSESCTRAQCAAFLYRYEQSQGKGFVGEWMFQLPFTDVPAWCYESVAWCYMNGVTEGTSATTFSPDDACTRAQIVTFLYRAAQVK